MRIDRNTVLTQLDGRGQQRAPLHLGVPQPLNIGPIRTLNIGYIYFGSQKFLEEDGGLQSIKQFRGPGPGHRSSPSENCSFDNTGHEKIFHIQEWARYPTLLILKIRYPVKCLYRIPL